MDKLENIKLLLENPVKTDNKKIISKFEDKQILIYGAGSFGKEMLSFFNDLNVNVSAFLDINAEKIKVLNEKPVYTLKDYNGNKNECCVIFSIVCDKDCRLKIINDIREAGFENIIEAQSIRCAQIDFTAEYSLDGAYDKIKEVYECFIDNKSREIFIENITAHLSRDYSNCGKNEDNMYDQYFPKDINAEKGYSVFIDCGGFIGDTVEQLMNYTSPSKVVSFEPFLDNYKRLCQSVKKYNLKNTEFILFNNAVSDKIGTMTFKTGTGSGTISKDGDITITTVSVDDVLRGLQPTFIKMDIEGEELKALNGIKETIKNSSPDMAICVYHNIDHLWEIPLFIRSLNNEYSFYLRNYNSFTMETVLYAYKRGGK